MDHHQWTTLQVSRQGTPTGSARYLFLFWGEGGYTLEETHMEPQNHSVLKEVVFQRSILRFHVNLRRGAY